VSSAARFTAADSIARLASAKDPSWNDPVVFRGRLYYRRSRLAVASPAQAKTFIDQGMGLAETALGPGQCRPRRAGAPRNPRILEVAAALEQNPATAAALFASARKDLEEATRLKPTQAGAWAR
jgi:hypothetical protein